VLRVSQQDVYRKLVSNSLFNERDFLGVIRPVSHSGSA
jgi:hypothetical protein